MKKISTKKIFHLTVRTFFIRLFYNYHNLFGEGLCYCLLPFLKNNQSSPNNDLILKKHMDFFNTNEYLSGFALGIIINLEAKNENTNLERTKAVLSSAFGSIGDKLTYKLIMPIFILIALNKFVISDFSLDNCATIIIFSEIFLFNIFNFGIRYYGIKSGYEKGIESIKFFKSNTYRRIILSLTYFRNILILLLIINLIIFNNIMLFFLN